MAGVLLLLLVCIPYPHIEPLTLSKFSGALVSSSVKME